ncbi:MAG TPA: dihydrofolate reductase [Cytophagales bacterium]|nr:dihydrofolate reductase [Cytophagales bacterium]
MIVSIIVARSKNNVIGRNNDLPWHLTDDLKNFRKITTGNPIIMGRKTYESIGKPLPGRTNIIVTRQKDYKVEGCEVVNSLPQALQIAKTINAKEAFIIGGAELINQSLEIVNKMYLTEVHAEIEGDTFLKSIDLSDWKLIDKKDYAKSEKGNEYDFSIIEYIKK